MMDKVELALCPKCGCDVVELHKKFEFVICRGCGHRGPYFDGHPIDAINAWNEQGLERSDGKRV